MEEHGVSKLVSVKFSDNADPRAKNETSIAGAFGKTENLASEDATAAAQSLNASMEEPALT
jgi:hypothetical protein